LETWRLIDLPSYDPFLNLSMEEAIFRSVSEGKSSNTIRFWCNSPCVIVGYSQHVMHEVEVDICKKMKIAIVRRFTGGGTVYQDLGNINFSFIIHKNHRLFSSSIMKTYEVVARGFIKGLELLGLRTDLSANEILFEGKKISGMAGANRFRACIRHGTLLVDSDLNVMKKVLRNFKKEVTNLNEHSVKKLTIDYVKEALIKGFEQEYSIKLEKDDLTSEERNTTNVLYEKKYSLDKWNFKK